MSLSQIEQLNASYPLDVNVHSSNTNAQNRAAGKKLLIKTEAGYNVVDLHKVKFIEADGPYIKIHKMDGTFLFIRIGINKFETFIERHPYFIRCHRSYIINLNFIQNVQFSDSTIYLTNNEMIPLAKRRRISVQTALQQFFITFNGV